MNGFQDDAFGRVASKENERETILSSFMETEKAMDRKLTIMKFKFFKSCGPRWSDRYFREVQSFTSFMSCFESNAKFSIHMTWSKAFIQMKRRSTFLRTNVKVCRSSYFVCDHKRDPFIVLLINGTER